MCFVNKLCCLESFLKGAELAYRKKLVKKAIGKDTRKRFVKILLCNTMGRYIAKKNINGAYKLARFIFSITGRSVNKRDYIRTIMIDSN